MRYLMLSAVYWYRADHCPSGTVDEYCRDYAAVESVAARHGVPLPDDADIAWLDGTAPDRPRRDTPAARTARALCRQHLALQSAALPGVLSDDDADWPADCWRAVRLIAAGRSAIGTLHGKRLWLSSSRDEGRWIPVV